MPVDNESQKGATYGIFYKHAELDGQHYADTKVKRYNDVVMVEIFIRGNNKASNSKPVFDKNGNALTVNLQGDTYLDMYPKAWARFNRDEGAELDGTPIRNLGGIGPSQILNLASTGIETVEDLAGLSDAVVVGESGMLDLRKRAIAYLASMHPEQAEQEKAEQQQAMEALRLEVQQMKDALANATVMKRGRPRKEVA